MACSRSHKASQRSVPWLTKAENRITMLDLRRAVLPRRFRLQRYIVQGETAAIGPSSLLKFVNVDARNIVSPTLMGQRPSPLRSRVSSSAA